MPKAAETDHDPVAVLDACVLFPASLRDTLLRLAETPRQYTPKWSDQILEEVTRNLVRRRNLAPEKIAHLIGQIENHFPEARITGYRKLVDTMTNDPKDRHVLAAAVHSGAQTIVTFNLKDFPADSLSEWGIKARHPDDFLIELLSHDPEPVFRKLRDQAATIDRTVPALLQTLRTGVPRFAADVALRLGLDIATTEDSQVKPETT